SWKRQRQPFRLPLLVLLNSLSGKAGEQIACLALLGDTALTDDLIENVASTFGVAHVDVGTRKIQLGSGFVSAGEEVEIIIAIGCKRRRAGNWYFFCRQMQISR